MIKKSFHILQSSLENSWLIPYAYGIVLLGFLFFLFRVFENWYANKYDKPIFRNLAIYRKLSEAQKEILLKDFHFYQLLSKKQKREFEHRISTFLKKKKFIGRQGLTVTDKMKVLIAAMGCMVSFGRKNYRYNLVDYILIYPTEFFSKANEQLHKGEFNPRERALVFSWEDFERGYRITDDKMNLGIHEFMHAMQVEAGVSRDLDSSRLQKQFQNILKRLTKQEVKDKLDRTRFFREYAFTNQYEFLAVLAEYFFEAPTDFKKHFPEIYDHTKKMLNFNFAGY